MKKLVLTLSMMVISSLGLMAQGGGGTPPDGGSSQGGGGSAPGGDSGGGSSSSSAVYPDGATYILSDGTTVTKTGETISCSTSDYNVVQVTSGNLTMNNCTLEKSGDTSSDGDNSSFYGVNSALFVGPTDSTKYSAVCNMTGGTITTTCKGANAVLPREAVYSTSQA